MLNSGFFELIIALTIGYLALGLVTSYLNDMIAGILQWRSQDATAGIHRMLENSGLAEAVLDHPLLQHVKDKQGRLPRYTPPVVFTAALIGLSAPQGHVSASLDDFKKFVGALPLSPAKWTLQGILDDYPNDRLKVEEGINQWFLRQMRFTASSFGQRILLVSLLVSILLTVVIGFDTLAVADYFMTRNVVNAALASAISSSPAANLDATLALVQQSLPIGWGSLPVSPSGWLRKILGLGVSALAVALFAPLSYNVREKFLPRLFALPTNVTKPLEDLRNAAAGDVQQIAASQILLLNEYQNQVLSQQNRSFLYALIAAVIGLVFFVVAVGIGIAQQTTNAAIVSALAGGIVEVISGINFYLYARTSDQVALFHSRLDMTQRFLLANSVCEKIEGEYKQQARAKLVSDIAAAMPAVQAAGAPKPEKSSEKEAEKKKNGS